MSGSGLSETSKPSDSMDRAPSLDLQKLLNLKGIGEIVEHLKRGDLSGVVGAIMAIWKEYFGTDEEKAEIQRVREAAKNEHDTKSETRSDLDHLREEVGQKESSESEDQETVELVHNPDLGDGRDIVFIGDSAANSMHLSYETDKRPGFIGQDGISTFQVLERLKAERSRLKNKQKAVIYCGGNNILGTPTEKLVEHMIEMSKICYEAGVPEIIINTQLPRDSRYEKNLGTERYKDLKIKSEAFRQELLKAYKDGRFPPGSKVVDLLKPFSDDKGDMKEAFVDPQTGDYIHTRNAYAPAVDYMMRTKASDNANAV